MSVECVIVFCVARPVSSGGGALGTQLFGFLFLFVQQGDFIGLPFVMSGTAVMVVGLYVICTLPDTPAVMVDSEGKRMEPKRLMSLVADDEDRLIEEKHYLEDGLTASLLAKDCLAPLDLARPLETPVLTLNKSNSAPEPAKDGNGADMVL